MPTGIQLRDHGWEGSSRGAEYRLVVADAFAESDCALKARRAGSRCRICGIRLVARYRPTTAVLKKDCLSQIHEEGQSQP